MQENGSRISEFVYVGYEITAGKVKLQGLPAYLYRIRRRSNDTLRFI
ncbi:MAG: hypothetical protein ACLTS6_03805 [Anaerobutyricum sp.]